MPPPNMHGLFAEIGDVVLMTVNKARHLGKIVGLDTGHANIVQIKALYHGVSTVLDRHVRTLSLIYRSSEWRNGIPLPPVTDHPEPHQGGHPQTPAHDHDPGPNHQVPGN